MDSRGLPAAARFVSLSVATVLAGLPIAAARGVANTPTPASTRNGNLHVPAVAAPHVHARRIVGLQSHVSRRLRVRRTHAHADAA